MKKNTNEGVQHKGFGLGLKITKSKEKKESEEEQPTAIKYSKHNVYHDDE